MPGGVAATASLRSYSPGPGAAGAPASSTGISQVQLPPGVVQAQRGGSSRGTWPSPSVNAQLMRGRAAIESQVSSVNAPGAPGPSRAAGVQGRPGTSQVLPRGAGGSVHGQMRR
mmetsp:Transcript_55510/g.104282  ORF Transcript_55510/g.104282 Transcript_55510/m.104282 type:complete len:114 (+) Transcript_55510:3-344(+)